MSNLTKLVLFFVGLLFLQTQAADKYTDENRPYEFGFTIDGEQHRHEKKDENGIIMGEFGFITADGVYHVTVYATDENGNFKILSMKNIRVKPYPTAPGTGLKKSNSITSTAQKDSIPESTKDEKTIKKQIASPAKSCSHCSLPTTTTKATPVLSKIPEKLRNSQYTETYNENGHKFNNNNRISSKNLGDQQKQNISKTKQSYTQAVSQNYQQKQPSNRNSQNENLSSSQNLGYQHPNVNPITTQYPKTIDNQKSLQQKAVPHNPLQINDQNGEQYFLPQNNPLNAEQQISVPGVRQNNPAVTIAGSRYPQSNPESISAVPHKPVQINTHNGEQYFVPQNNPLNAKQQISVPGVRQNNPTVTITGSRYPQSNAESISRTLKGPINKENYPTNLALPQNNQEKNGFKNDNQNDLKNNNYKYTEVQQQKKYDQYGKMNQPNQLMISLPTIVTSRQSLQPQSEKSILENPKGERSPKSFADFIQQSVGPEELASTGPNLYRPSLPKASEFSGKPVLLAAQMQKVDKKTDIYNKNPGESNGLPEGITLDDVKNLLYTFNYTVGFHGHHEKGYSNGVKQGYYYVTGRNGVKTRVDYIADENGFQPKITQEILNVVSDEVPKPETEKDEKYGLKGYEFKWLYFPLDSQSV